MTGGGPTGPDPAASGGPGGGALRLEGGLHPASFLLRLDRLVRFAFFIGLALVFRGSTDLGPMLGPVVAFLALGLVGPLLELASFRWRLTATELTVRSGVFARTERRIPVDRIHDLGFEQTFVRRLLGLVKVTVETSSTGGAEASMDALDPATAERLRQAIEALGGLTDRGAPERAAAATGPREEGRLLHRAGAGALLARGLTDNRAGVLVLVAASLAQLFATVTGTPLELFLADRWVDNAHALVRAPSSAWLALAAVIVASAYALGWIVGAGLSVVTYHGFTLRERRGVFVRRFGLFTRRTLSLPARRIQLVEIVQSPVRRLLRVGYLRVESAGSVATEEARGQEASEGTAIFVPFASLDALGQVADRLVPGAASALPWERTHPSIVLRTAVRGLVLGGLGALAWHRGAALLALPAPGAGALGAVVAAAGAVFATAGALRFATLRFARTDTLLAVRDGRVGRTHVLVPLERVEAITLDAGPLDRLRRIARVTVHVLGGAGVTVPNVPRARAERLVRELGGDLGGSLGAEDPGRGAGGLLGAVASGALDPLP